MTKVPPLHDCPRCGLAVQKGRGPNGLAWHDCPKVLELKERASSASMTAEDAARELLAVAVKRAPTMPGKELAAILGHVARMAELKGGKDGKGKAGDDGDGRPGLLQILRSDDADEESDPAADPVHAAG